MSSAAVHKGTNDAEKRNFEFAEADVLHHYIQHAEHRTERLYSRFQSRPPRTLSTLRKWSLTKMTTISLESIPGTLFMVWNFTFDVYQQNRLSIEACQGLVGRDLSNERPDGGGRLAPFELARKAENAWFALAAVRRPLAAACRQYHVNFHRKPSRAAKGGHLTNVSTVISRQCRSARLPLQRRLAQI